MVDDGEVGTDVVAGGGVFGLMAVAAEKGMSLEDLKGLFGLQTEIDARNDRKAFYRALAAFRAECPQPKKTRENSQFKVTRNGVSRASKYAPLEEIDRVAGKVAAKHGLAWTYDTKMDGQFMHVTCKLAHEDGHMEPSTVSMPYESKAGSSPQQKYGSTQTYGMRYSLIAALGLTAADEDVDGAAAVGGGGTITEEQVADLAALIEDVGADMARFLAWANVERLEDLPERDLGAAIKALEKKRDEK